MPGKGTLAAPGSAAQNCRTGPNPTAAPEGLKNTGLLLFIAILWSLNGLFIKMVDWHPLAISSARSCVTAAVLLLYYRRVRFTWTFDQLAGALAYALTMILFVAANKMTTAANAILLQYTAPVHVALLSYWILKERVTRFDWLATLTVMGGMVLFFLDELTLGYLGGNLLAIASGFTFALFTLFMRKQKAGSPAETVILGSLLTVGIGLPFLFLSGPPAGAWSWPVLIIMGFFIALSFILYSRVIRLVRALEAILVFMLEPLLNPLWVFLIMGEKPGPWSLVGGTLIVASVALRGAAAVREGYTSSTAPPPPAPSDSRLG